MTHEALSSYGMDRKLKLVAILSDVNGRFVVEQQPEIVFSLPMIAMLAILSIFVCIQRSWVYFLVLVIMVVILCTLSIVKGKSTYRAEIDSEAGEIISKRMDKGKLTARTIVPLNNIASAKMQYNADSSATRIMLLLRDGSKAFPLGRNHMLDEPAHHIALSAIQQAIARDAAWRK